MVELKSELELKESYGLGKWDRILERGSRDSCMEADLERTYPKEDWISGAGEYTEDSLVAG